MVEIEKVLRGRVCVGEDKFVFRRFDFEMMVEAK